MQQDMADNYLNSIVNLGVKNFVVAPMDSKTHKVMSNAYPGHILPVIPERKCFLPDIGNYCLRFASMS